MYCFPISDFVLLTSQNAPDIHLPGKTILPSIFWMFLYILVMHRGHVLVPVYGLVARLALPLRHLQRQQLDRALHGSHHGGHLFDHRVFIFWL